MAAEASLMRDALVYLGAAVLCVPVAKRLGLGSVLGYLIAGCAIGPWGLRLVSDPQSMLHFAEFGVVLMLFVIGLELDVKRLVEMRKPVFNGGGLQMAACGVLLSGGLWLYGLDWPAATVAGLALAMSSTAIAVQTMTEKNLLNAPLGHSAFGVLLFQDIAAIPLIALVPLVAGMAGMTGLGDLGGAIGSQGASTVAAVGAATSAAAVIDGAATSATIVVRDPFWLAALKALAAIGAVILIGRVLTRPLLRAIATTDVREIFTAFALLLVIGIAQLMTLAGLSMALGAFLAGVLLASSEYRKALETDLAPFRGLLLGLFFIAVGMSVDFGLVMARPVALTVLVTGLLGLKGTALALIAKRLGVAARERWLFAALLAQGGEFAFVVLGVARTAGMLPPADEALITAAVALSMALTPLLIMAAEHLAQRGGGTRRQADAIDNTHAPVIIAGYGRYGQIVGRLLSAQGIEATVLDHDPDQIDLLRRFGTKVFYGDATRLDLLEAAGAAHAKLLVVAIDQVEDSLALVDLARESFPKLAIVARARNVRHWLELSTRGVEAIERETFESALRSGRQALQLLGMPAYEARELADSFRRHNVATLAALKPHFGDEAQTVAVARSGRAELEENLRRDREARQRVAHSTGWQSRLEAVDQAEQAERTEQMEQMKQAEQMEHGQAPAAMAQGATQANATPSKVIGKGAD